MSLIVNPATPRGQAIISILRDTPNNRAARRLLGVSMNTVRAYRSAVARIGQDPTPRSAQAREAAKARWAKKTPPPLNGGITQALNELDAERTRLEARLTMVTGAMAQLRSLA